jgi:hypothetical protein
VPSLDIASGDTLNPSTRRKPFGLCLMGKDSFAFLADQVALLELGIVQVLGGDDERLGELQLRKPRAARTLEEKVILAAAIVSGS